MPTKDPIKRQAHSKRYRGKLTPEQKDEALQRDNASRRARRADPAKRAHDNIKQKEYRESEHGKQAHKRSRQKRREQNQDIVNMLKIAPCLDCGGLFPVCAMQFDHARGKKRRCVSWMVTSGRPEKELRAEIAKCDIVCANCHCVRTFTRGQHLMWKTKE